MLAHSRFTPLHKIRYAVRVALLTASVYPLEGWQKMMAQRNSHNYIEGVHFSCVLTHRFL